MKKTLLLLWCTCITLAAFSQNSAHKPHHLYVSLGTSAPLANIDEFIGIQAKGMIKNGYMAKISYAGDIKRHFSLGATVGRSLNNFDNKALASAADGTVEIDPWTTTFLLADAYLKLPIKKLSIYGKGSFGISLPQTWTATAVSGAYTGTLSTIEAAAAAYGASVGVSYALGRFEVGVEADALVTHPELQFEYRNFTERRRQLIGTQNNTLRIGLMF